LRCGAAARIRLQAVYTYRPTAEDTWTVQAYASHYSLDLFSDFTLYQNTGLRFSKAGGVVTDNRGVENPPLNANYIPGDGIEQSEDRWIWGGLASYQRYWFLYNIPVQSEIAFQTRNDYIGNLALYRQVQRTRFFPVNLDNVQESSVSGYTSHQLFLADWARFEVGLRGDLYYFDVSNQLPLAVFNPDADPNFDAVYINGNSNSDGIISPKANLVVTPVENTDLYFNFGTGFHSNDARGVILAKTNPSQSGGEITPLVRAIGGELGARTRQFDPWIWLRRCGCWTWTVSSSSPETRGASRSPRGAISCPAARRGAGGSTSKPATRCWTGCSSTTI
jgi:outer membrane receptor protein involved in Fe transport